MNLGDLTREERLGLVALIRRVVLADGSVSVEEAEMLPAIVEEIGEAAYREAVEEVDRRFTTEAMLRRYLEAMRRAEARELIYGTVLELAMADGVAPSESPLLDWLGDTWDLEPTLREED